MLVIADSSALVALATCEALDVLLELFDEIKVPQAVYSEVVSPGKFHASTIGLFPQRTGGKRGYNSICPRCWGTWTGRD